MNEVGINVPLSRRIQNITKNNFFAIHCRQIVEFFFILSKFIKNRQIAAVMVYNKSKRNATIAKGHQYLYAHKSRINFSSLL